MHDLGAGDGSLAAVLVELGATHVIAVDRVPLPPRVPGSGRRQYDVITAAFDRYHPSDTEVCVLSWPVNGRSPGLIPLLGRFGVLAYIGSNVEGSACGSPELFTYLLTRELLDHVPHRANTLVVCGRVTSSVRRPTWEEAAGLDQQNLHSPVRPYRP